MPYIDYIVNILRDAATPMSAREISKRLKVMGILQQDNTPILESQIRDRIRKDKKRLIQTIPTNSYTYEIKPADEKPYFEAWLKSNHPQISRPEKYSAAINTISNDLKHVVDAMRLFQIKDPTVLSNLKLQYFNTPEFEEKNIRGNRMYSRAFDLYIQYVSGLSDNSFQEIVEIIRSEEKEQEKEALILTRLGQGKYRNELIKIWKRCAISGYSDVSLLVASHIKPWSKCNNMEKVDPYNGLLLLPNYDKLFDKGLISFEENGSILISEQFTDSDNLFGVDASLEIELFEENKKYMRYHRRQVFKK